MPYLPLATQTNDAPWSGERCLNFIPHAADTTSSQVLLGRSGMSEIHATGVVRAWYPTETTLWVAAGGRLWAVTDGGATDCGFISDSVNTYIAADHQYVAVVASGSYRVYDIAAGTLTTYTTGAVDLPRGVAYMDGYFLVWGEGNGRKDTIQPSDLDDATSFDPLDFRTAETQADSIKCIVTQIGGIAVVGGRTIEGWYLSTTGWVRSTPSGINRGCLNGRTVAADDDGLIWVGDDRRVYRSSGSLPSIVSTEWVERAIKSGAIRSGFIYRDRGHRFYCIVRYEGTTLALDLDTGRWVEFSSGTEGGPFIATEAVYFGNRYLLGTDTGISQQLPTWWKDNGAEIVAEAINPPLDKGGAPFNPGTITLRMNSGSNVQVMGQFSRDGANWGREKWRETGETGAYGRYVRWRAQGQFRPQFQMKVRVTDNGNRDIYGVTYG